jgi:hypothetical protein
MASLTAPQAALGPVRRAGCASNRQTRAQAPRGWRTRRTAPRGPSCRRAAWGGRPLSPRPLWQVGGSLGRPGPGRPDTRMLYSIQRNPVTAMTAAPSTKIKIAHPVSPMSMTNRRLVGDVHQIREFAVRQAPHKCKILHGTRRRAALAARVAPRPGNLRPPRAVPVLMRSHSIAALLRRVDRLLARAAKARQEMESAKAESDERRRAHRHKRDLAAQLERVAASAGRRPVGVMLVYTRRRRQAGQARAGRVIFPAALPELPLVAGI